jgi:site-specific DNA-methyltransferase (adenine-specific)
MSKSVIIRDIECGFLIEGDAIASLKELETGCVRTCITSPPYFGLRDYGVDGQIGMERTLGEYIRRLRNVFREVRRVLSDDGTLWVNIGDGYNGVNGYARANNGWYRTGRDGALKNTNGGMVRGLKAKNLLGIPWLLAFALRADGWYLRSDIIWSKPNAQPENIKDRPIKSHEYIFLLSKSQKYYYDNEAIKVPAKPPYGKKNIRSVWDVPVKSNKQAHFAVFPEKLIEPCVLAGSAPGDFVLDPFCGSGTTGVMAVRHNRLFIGCDINESYVKMSEGNIVGEFNKVINNKCLTDQTFG